MNHHTPPDALDVLSLDGDSNVQWVTLLHPRTPARAVVRLAHEATAHCLAVHHPNTPEPIRQRLLDAGVCKNSCHGPRIYTHRHPWRSRYLPAGLFRRTAGDDQSFFAAGACHILAWAMLERHPDRGLTVHALRRRGEAYAHHVFVSDGLWAFDHCGWTLDTELREAYDSEVLVIRTDLGTFCAEHDHRLPEQFALPPWARARDFIARYE
jgi:hypothetical protein